MPTLKSFWERNKPNGSMRTRLTLRLMGARWTQADGEQKAPFTGLFTVSGKWNSSFFFFFFKWWSICSSLSKQGKNREQRKRNKDSWLKGKNTSLRSTDPKENSQSPEVKKDPIAVVEVTLPGSLAGLWASTETPLLPSLRACRLVGHRPWGSEHLSCSCRKIS